MAATGIRVAAAAGRRGSRRGLARLGLWSVGAVLLCASLSGLQAPPAGAFVSGAVVGAARGRVLARAEPEAAPAPAPAPSTEESTALVKVTEENVLTAAGILGGVVGLVVGGLWLGAATFVASSYFVRQENDVSKALRGVATGSLEAVNFGASVNDKYKVTDQVGGAVSNAVDSAKKNPDTKEAASAVTGFVDNVVGAVGSVDKEVGIKDNLGKLAVSAGDVANKAVEKAVELNKEYKVTDQIKEKVEEVTKSK
mmetsp:Transcript_45475/g.144973  ORF Transcript_45475/g.144973 Transcript_45475/m.144973 type:complete len:254 (-) Transcript_45475:47-808(-)